MQRYWLFIAILIVSLNFAILTATWWCWLIVALLMLRIVVTQVKVLILFSICTGISWGGYFYWYHSRPARPLPTSHVIVVQPDAYVINGGRLQFEAMTDQGRTMAFYQAKRPQELTYFQKTIQPLVLTIRGRYQRPAPATNVAAFDYAAYLKQQRQIQSVLTIEKIQLVQPQQLTLQSKLASIRKRLLINFSQLPQPVGTYAQCLILGYQDLNFRQFAVTLRKLGIIHLFSLSGLHVYCFVGILSRLLLRLHITHELKDRLLLIFLPLYACLAGGSTSLSRAVGLCWLVTLSRCFHTKWPQTDVFSFVLLLHLTLQPTILLGLGGQLSYLLALTLIVMPTVNTLRMTLTLNLLSLPLILYQVYEVHWLTVVLNWFMVPIFAHFILPALLVAVCVAPIFPQLAVWLAVCFDQLQTGLTYFTTPRWLFVYGRPFAWIIVSIIGLTFVALMQSRQHRYWTIALILTLYLGNYGWLRLPNQAQVTMIDIGQGDSILLDGPHHQQTTLIDTGGRLAFRQPAWQQGTTTSRVTQITIPYLKSQGIHKLDQVFLSHQDAEHIGDLKELLQQFPVNRVYFPLGMENNPTFRKRIRTVKQCCTWRPVQAGAITAIAGGRFQVLHPTQAGRGENDDSLVLYGQINRRRWLFTGDLSAAVEEKLIQKRPLPVDYLKAGHHGSQTATAVAFLEALQPKRVLISSGRHNRYGHPHEAVLQRLRQRQIPYFNTAKVGMIRWQARTDHWTVQLKEPIQEEVRKVGQSSNEYDSFKATN